jgi:Mis12 protein
MFAVFICRRRAADIRNGCDELHHLLRSVFDRNFDKFELYSMRNILNVPTEVAQQLEVREQASVPAPSFSGLMVTEEDEEAARAEVEALQAQILELRAQRRALITVKRHAEAKIPHCQSVVDDVSSILTRYAEKDGEDTVADVATAADALDTAVSQLKAAFLG